MKEYIYINSKVLMFLRVRTWKYGFLLLQTFFTAILYSTKNIDLKFEQFVLSSFETI